MLKELLNASSAFLVRGPVKIEEINVRSSGTAYNITKDVGDVVHTHHRWFLECVSCVEVMIVYRGWERLM